MNQPRRFMQRLVLIAGLAALSFAAQAQMPPGHGHGRHHPPGPMMEGEGPMPPYLHGLKLTDAQQDKVFAIFHNQAPQMREKAKAARKAREELRDLALSDKYDETRAAALAQAGAKAMADLALLRARTDQQILALLTPEQKAAVAAGKPCHPGKE